MKDFRDRVAVITGAGSGIGRALALRFARRGAHLALSDVNEEGLAETARQVAGHGRVTTTRLDVSDREAVYAHAEEVEREHGAAHLVVNNAGVALVASARRCTIEEMEWLMGINFWGVVYGTKAFLPILEKQPEGHIVNISSIFGIIAYPMNSAYNASKFAVRGFTEALRIELELDGSSVSCTSVHPGGIKTNIAASARHGANDRTPDRDKLASTFEKMARTTPDQCAATIISAVEKNLPRVLVGTDAQLMEKVQRTMPAGYQKAIIKVGQREWDRFS